MRLTCSFRMPLRFARHSAGGMALTPLKPDWAQFEWPRGAKAAE